MGGYRLFFDRDKPITDCIIEIIYLIVSMEIPCGSFYRDKSGSYLFNFLYKKICKTGLLWIKFLGGDEGLFRGSHG